MLDIDRELYEPKPIGTVEVLSNGVAIQWHTEYVEVLGFQTPKAVKGNGEEPAPNVVVGAPPEDGRSVTPADVMQCIEAAKKLGRIELEKILHDKTVRVEVKDGDKGKVVDVTLVHQDESGVDHATQEDFGLTVCKVVGEAHDTAVMKGWWDESRTDLELLALICSEVGEAVETCREGEPIWRVVTFKDGTGGHPGKPEGLLSELADIVIRVADMCGKRGWNLAYALRKKMEFNRTRPHRHGGKKA